MEHPFSDSSIIRITDEQKLSISIPYSKIAIIRLLYPLYLKIWEGNTSQSVLEISKNNLTGTVIGERINNELIEFYKTKEFPYFPANIVILLKSKVLNDLIRYLLITGNKNRLLENTLYDHNDEIIQSRHFYRGACEDEDFKILLKDIIPFPFIIEQELELFNPVKNIIEGYLEGYKLEIGASTLIMNTIAFVLDFMNEEFFEQFNPTYPPDVKDYKFKLVFVITMLVKYSMDLDDPNDKIASYDRVYTSIIFNKCFNLQPFIQKFIN